ncbi:MAG: SRPBCC family protein [Deltaproteobacteria bacterium]|nr:SRPBCC family protein [Deltaproteobacteria bacterium]
MKIRKSIRIDAPIDRVFEYLTHPQNLLEIWPSMVEVSNVTQKADGTHSYDWVYKMAHMKFHGHSETIELEKNARVVVRNDTGIPSTFIWTYAGENGGTKLTVEVEYALPIALLDKLAEPFISRLNDREAETLLENLKLRMETGASKSATSAASTPVQRH